MKKIWLINYYAATPDDTGNARYFELAKHLQATGYDVRVFSAGFIGKKEVVPEGQAYVNKEYYGLKYTHIRVPHFVGNGVKRMLSIWKFATQMVRLRNEWDQPDIVYLNEHAPFDYPVIKLAKKLKARFVIEAWDLWPHDFVTFGLVGAKNPALKVAYAMERRMYEAATDIVYTFRGGIDYLRMQKWTTESKGGRIDPTRVHYINNGLLLNEFYQNVEKHPSQDADLNAKDKFKVVYLGSVNLVNNVKQLIDAAALLQDDPKYSFLIYGGGADKQRLVEYVEEQGIKNVIFKADHIPYHNCAYVVSQASLNVMNYKKGFADWGVSSGKMFQYMAAGRPILCNIKINYSDIELYHCGIDRDLETPEQYAAAIREIASLPQEEYNQMCLNAKEAAKEFDYDVLAQRLIDEVLERK